MIVDDLRFTLRRDCGDEPVSKRIFGRAVRHGAASGKQQGERRDSNNFQITHWFPFWK